MFDIGFGVLTAAVVISFAWSIKTLLWPWLFGSSPSWWSAGGASVVFLYMLHIISAAWPLTDEQGQKEGGKLIKWTIRLGLPSPVREVVAFFLVVAGALGVVLLVHRLVGIHNVWLWVVLTFAGVVILRRLLLGPEPPSQQ